MKKIISIILALVMCFFAVAALASCGESAYDIAVKNGFKGTEEQWLQSLKGDAGAKGEDAAAPTIEIDKDGYWVINGVKTDVKATGDAGDKGSEGADGREVEFRKGTTHIQWRYKGEADSAWKDLISIKELQGAAGSNGSNGTNGEDGKDGREVVFRTGETHIQWKYKNEADTEWKDLVAISTLKGADGKDSRDVQFKVGETHLQWKYADEPDTDWKNLVDVAALQGADGREVEFNVDAEKQLLQWRYKGDEAWTDLSELSIFNGADGESAYELAVKNGFVGTEAEWLDSLKGAKGDKGEQGEQGEAGKDGREVEVFVANDQIRWRYVGEKGSYPLIEVEEITGNSIDNITTTKNGLVTTVTISYTKENYADKTFTISDGNGVDYISTPVPNGLVDTYTIYYTNGTSSTFDVTNGNGIDRIEKTGTDVLVDTYTVYFTNGTSTTYTVTNGNGIDRIEKTGTNELVDTYTIYYTNGTFTTFEVVNGRQGVDGKSAYEVAVENGLVPTGMTEVEWVASLKGESAREVEFRMNGPQLQWRYKTDENGDPYEENEGWINLYNFGVELVQTNFAVWKGAAAPTLQIKKDENTIIDVDPAVHIIAGSVDFTQGGTYPITVTYNGKMSEYEITVTTYELVETDFTLWNGDEAKLQIKVTKPDTTVDTLDVDPTWITGAFDATLAGTYNFTVTYDGLESPAQTVTIETIRITATDLFTWKGVKPEIEIVHTNASDPIPNISNRTPDQLGITADMSIAGEYTTTVTFGTDVSPELTFNVTTYELNEYDFITWGKAPELKVVTTAPDGSTTTSDALASTAIETTDDLTTYGYKTVKVTYNGLQSANINLEMSTLELVEDTFEIWTHWDASKMPALQIKYTDASGSDIPVSDTNLTVTGDDIDVAGTHTVRINYLGVESDDITIKVTSYEVKESAFWYTQAETDLVLVTTTPDGVPTETALAYTGTITWGTAGTYPIVAQVGGLAAETINVVIRPAGLYKADGTQIATWAELGIVPGTNYTAAAFQTTEGSGYYALMSDTSPYKDMTGLTLVLPADATVLGNHAFRKCTNLSTVILSPNTTKIGTHVFLLCTALENITIPASVDSIGTSAFQNCSSLKSIVIPEGVTSIGNSAFLSCTSLTSVDIPGSITSLGTKVFSGCTALKTVNLGEGLYGVAYQMFANCTSLEEITIPAGTAIMNKAFEYCTALKKVTFEAWPDNMGYDTSTATSSAFYGCTERSIDIVINGNFISNEKTSVDGAWIISRQQKSIKSVTIGAGVTEIPTGALDNLDGITITYLN